MVLRGFLFISVSVASPASAAEDFIEGVYLQSEDLCAQARKDTLQSLIDAGNIVLSARGLQSVEYDCEFLQITKATLSPVPGGDSHMPGARPRLSGRSLRNANEREADRSGFGPICGRRKRRGQQQRQLFPLRRRGPAIDLTVPVLGTMHVARHAPRRYSADWFSRGTNKYVR